MKSLATVKLTSASSRARRTSCRPSRILASVRRPRPRSFFSASPRPFWMLSNMIPLTYLRRSAHVIAPDGESNIIERVADRCNATPTAPTAQTLFNRTVGRTLLACAFWSAVARHRFGFLVFWSALARHRFGFLVFWSAVARHRFGFLIFWSALARHYLGCFWSAVARHR